MSINVYFGSSMKIMKFISLSVVLLFTSLSWAQTTPQISTEEMTAGYISDDLFIYMHSGPGKNYRILGTINSGTEIAFTGKSTNEYSQIIDAKDREAWVESKYVSDKPGLRNVIAELNGKLASYSEAEAIVSTKLNEAKVHIQNIESQNKTLNKTIESLNIDLSDTKLQIKDQDMNIKKQWFYNGAIVLCIGLILGLLIPKIGSKRKASMDSWK